MAEEHNDHGHAGGGEDSHSKKHASHGPPHGGGSHEEHEGAPEWLISFADNVALMMGFFVILLAMNMKEPTVGGVGGKDANGGTPQYSASLLDAVIAIREAFHSPIDMGSTNPGEQPMIKRIKEKGTKGETHIEGPEGEHHEAQTPRPSDLLNIGGIVPFEEHSAEVSDAGKRTIEEVARLYRGKRWIIEVRGHASRSEMYEDQAAGSKLCFERAYAVAALLVEEMARGGGDQRAILDQVRMVSAGSGDPAKARTDSAAERQVNQRVEIILTDEEVPPDAFTKDR